MGRALELSELIGPKAVDRVKALTREWRGPMPTKPKAIDRHFGSELDELLGPDDLLGP